MLDKAVQRFSWVVFSVVCFLSGSRYFFRPSSENRASNERSSARQTRLWFILHWWCFFNTAWALDSKQETHCKFIPRGRESVAVWKQPSTPIKVWDDLSGWKKKEKKRYKCVFESVLTFLCSRWNNFMYLITAESAARLFAFSLWTVRMLNLAFLAVFELVCGDGQWDWAMLFIFYPLIFM